MLEALLACSPQLPRGFTAQAAWSFRDESGGFTYELNRVYATTSRLRDRVGIVGQLLDEERSYWAVTWLGAPGTEREHACGRWISYAQARKLVGPAMTFARFSSLEDMRDGLPALLKVGARAASPVAGRTWRRAPGARRPTATMDTARWGVVAPRAGALPPHA